MRRIPVLGVDYVNAYAGIGSRETPDDILSVMTECARLLCARGWRLRTGGAPGADTAFLSGCLLWCPPDPPNYELYLPWPGFSDQAPPTLDRPTATAYNIASHYHPRWNLLSRGPRALHARNVHQVLGRDCNDPVKMIVCWTKDGSLTGHGNTTGGTGQALRIVGGEAPGAQVFNLRLDEHRERIEHFTSGGNLGETST
jgi:hypothetical protein